MMVNFKRRLNEKYILLTNEELKTLLDGGEIKHSISGVGEIYFMSRECFMKSIDENNEEGVDKK